jgi:hypothetical protein
LKGKGSVVAGEVGKDLKDMRNEIEKFGERIYPD